MKPIPIPSFIILHYIFPPMRYNKKPSPNSNREMSQKLKFKMKICKLRVSKVPFNFRNNHISSCGTPTSRRCSLLIFHRAGYTKVAHIAQKANKSFPLIMEPALSFLQEKQIWTIYNIRCYTLIPELCIDHCNFFKL